MPDKLRVVVLGYYGHLNAGDDLLQASVCSVFREHDLMFSKWFPGIDLINQADLLVVGGGSIWPGHTVFQNASSLAKRLKVPLFVMGISARQKSEAALAQTRDLIRYASVFHVRDRSTFELLGEHPDILVGADLYWWSEHHIPPVQPDMRSVALNLRDWNELAWSPTDIVRACHDKDLAIHPWPLYYGASAHERSGQLDDATLMSRLLSTASVPSSFSIEPLVNAAFSICMRFHAIQMSVRAGRPVIGFDYHLKTKNFFEENGLGELCVDLRNPQALGESIDRLTANYPAYEKKFTALRDRLIQQGRTDREHVEAVLATIGRRRPRSTERRIAQVKAVVRRVLG